MSILEALLGASNVGKKETANQLASDPVISPQPFGLTNFQSKLIAPMFTRAWRLHHHDVNSLPPQLSEVATLKKGNLYEPPALTIHEMPDCLIPQPVAAAFAFADNDPELNEALLASCEDDANVMALTSKPAFSTEAAEAWSKVSADAREALDPLIVKAAHTRVFRPVQFIATHAAGWEFERCLAVAIYGRECLYSAVVKALTTALADDNNIEAERAYAAAYACVFIDEANRKLTDSEKLAKAMLPPPPSAEDAKRILRSAIAEGGQVDKMIHLLRTAFVANLLQRPIIHINRHQKAPDNTCSVVCPTKVPEGHRRPIVIAQRNVVVVSPAHPAFDGERAKITLAAGAKTMYPHGASETDYFDLAEGNIVTNCGARGRDVPFVLPPNVWCIDPVKHANPSASDLVARANSTALSDAEMKEKQLSDEAILSIEDESPTFDFSTFPASYFTLAQAAVRLSGAAVAPPKKEGEASATATADNNDDKAKSTEGNNASFDRNTTGSLVPDDLVLTQGSCGGDKGVVEDGIRTLQEAPGFGRDDFSADYLDTILRDGTHNAVPMHVDADGHCLLHAVSRLLIGKEYLWHALRTNLHRYMRRNAPAIKAAFKKTEMLEALCEEYDAFSRRADPKYSDPSQPITNARGLGPEHVFALANLLRRPIVLLDRIKAKDAHREAWIFLPLLHKPEDCVTKKVLVVAWASEGYHHYVPIIPKYDDACLLKAGIPVLQTGDDDGPQVPAVYGLPKDGNAAELLNAYVAVNAENGSIPMGGETRFDVRHWCHYVCEDFRRTTDTSIWSLHELARMMVQSRGTDSSELSVLQDTDAFLQSAVQVLKGTKLYFCPSCTRTNHSSLCQSSSCTSLGRELEVRTGRFDLKFRDSMPLRADPKLGCCGWKHWCTAYGTKGIPRKGSLVFARDLTDGFATAEVSGAEISETTGQMLFHLEFLNNGVRRSCVPSDDMLMGFPVDHILRQQQIAASRMTFDCLMVLDAHPRVRTDPRRHSAEIMDRYREQLQAFKKDDREHIRSVVEQLIKSNLDATGEILYEKYQKKEEKHAPMMAQGELAFTDPEDNAPVVWESEDPRTREWLPYERTQTGTIEAAYQSGETSCVIKIEGFGFFTIKLSTLSQENDMGGSRPVRRVKKTQWKCSACTLENPPDHDYCGACAAPRPHNARKVVRDRSTLAKDRIKRAYTDDRLKRGGDLFKAASKHDDPLGEHRVRFPSNYGDSLHFVFWFEFDRYIPAQNTIEEDDPIYKVLMEKLDKTTRLVHYMDIDYKLHDDGVFRYIDLDPEPDMRRQFMGGIGGMQGGGRGMGGGGMGGFMF